MDGGEQASFGFLKSEEICRLNDNLRQHGVGGRFMITPGIAALPRETLAAVMAAVQSFDAFDPGNDPYGEHDMGVVEIHGHKAIWKIDYYADADMEYGAEDPSDPKRSFRVLTIMLAAEY